jgi:hypothetical protein
MKMNGSPWWNDRGYLNMDEERHDGDSAVIIENLPAEGHMMRPTHALSLVNSPENLSKTCRESFR